MLRGMTGPRKNIALGALPYMQAGMLLLYTGAPDTMGGLVPQRGAAVTQGVTLDPSLASISFLQSL